MRVYTQRMILALVAFAGFIVVCISLSMTLQPIDGQRVYPILPTTPTPITTAANTTTTTITTPTTTTRTTTAAAPTTTPVPYVPINVSCPPDVSVVLGSSLDPTYTGQALLSAASGRSCGAPVLLYSDQGTLGSAFFRRSERQQPQQMTHEIRQDPEQQGVAMNGVRRGRGSLPKSVILGSTIKGKRSPTFAQANIDPQYGNFLEQSGLGVARPDHNGASSATQTISAISTALGSLYFVTDPAFVTVWLAFSASDSFGLGNCAVPGTVGESTVNWDEQAQRWIILERAAVGNTLCLYLSSSADALDPWLCYAFNMGATVPSYAQLGIWPQAYAISLNVTGGIGNLCVLDRLALLGGDPTPALFCGTSLSGPLAGFTRLQSWTPLGVEGDAAMPSNAIESANVGDGTVGAVWMRQHDAQLHDAAPPTAGDWLDVEQWTNINFTLSTYIPLRYVIGISPFDSSYAACESEVACVPLPPLNTSVDPVRQVIMRRLVYRDGSAWGSFVSNANGIDTAHVRWFELKWKQPTPMQSPRWMLEQEGNTATNDTIHRWLSSIAIDSQGTVVLGYNAGNEALAAAMMAKSRLANDPANGMRDEIFITSGVQPYTIPSNNSEWGSFQTISTVPGTPRTFLFNGQVQFSTLLVYAFALRIRGETIIRTWTAADTCSSASCNQTIIEQ